MEHLDKLSECWFVRNRAFVTINLEKGKEFRLTVLIVLICRYYLPAFGILPVQVKTVEVVLLDELHHVCDETAGR